MGKRITPPFAACLTLLFCTQVASAQLKPFELEVKQTALFGRADGAFLQGGISDTILGALLRTKQERVSGESRILRTQFAPDLASQLEHKRQVFVPDLPARSGFRADLPLKAKSSVFDLRAAQPDFIALEGKPTAFVELMPTSAPDEHVDLQAKAQAELPDLTTQTPRSELELEPLRKPVLQLESQAARPAVAPLEREHEAVKLDLDTKSRSAVHFELEPKRARVSASLAEATKVKAVLTLEPKHAEPATLPPALVANAVPIPITLPVPKPKPEPVLKPQKQRTPKSNPKEETTRVAAKLKPMPKATTQPTPQVTPRLAKQDQQLLWDAWYERVGKECDARFTQELERRGNPIGSCTLQVFVLNDLSIGVTAIARSGEPFTMAALTAYRSMDHNPILQFPSGSKRKQVRFLVRNKQSDEGLVTDIDAERIRGDKEIF